MKVTNLLYTIFTVAVTTYALANPKAEPDPEAVPVADPHHHHHHHGHHRHHRHEGVHALLPGFPPGNIKHNVYRQQWHREQRYRHRHRHQHTKYLTHSANPTYFDHDCPLIGQGCSKAKRTAVADHAAEKVQATKTPKLNFEVGA